ncbi:BrnT family toxin [Endozoicomonas euniceicola]|uniref:BrnT family toxin n=1 Tax=Endozoicomonas euniceicola TaxID=1234143 RepID=A0ABY6GV88_9GAMM|nr:BrnT family toxin [Endozoicomonas euniceicola]UYM16001.1 BrnT family toxin [Endozoicomonas euniceicola]
MPNERWVAIGRIQHLTGVVVYTEKVGDIIRIISARKATKREIQRYEENIIY